MLQNLNPDHHLQIKFTVSAHKDNANVEGNSIGGGGAIL